jgi:hypothetical protein
VGVSRRKVTIGEVFIGARIQVSLAARNVGDSRLGDSLDPYLDEANVGRLLTEALTADVKAVLADQTGLVGADTAKLKLQVSISPFYCQ